IVGKYCGLLMTLVVNAALMTIGLYSALLITAHELTVADTRLLVAVYFIILQFLIVTALTLLFSSFSSPIFSAVCAFALFAIGTFGDDLRSFAAMAHGATKWLTTVAAYVVPNMASLNVIARVAYNQPVSGKLIAFNTLYALFYSTAVTAGAVLIFERRNLK